MTLGSLTFNIISLAQVGWTIRSGFWWKRNESRTPRFVPKHRTRCHVKQGLRMMSSLASLKSIRPLRLTLGCPPKAFGCRRSATGCACWEGSNNRGEVTVVSHLVAD